MYVILNMQKPIVKLTNLIHKNQSIVKLGFDKNPKLYQLVRQLPNLNYSKTHGAWYLPYTTATIELICSKLNAIAYVDYKDLTHTKPQAQNLSVPKNVKPKTEPLPILDVLSAQKLDEINDFKQWLQSKRYSQNTISTYVDALKTFLRYYNNKCASEISNNDVIVFNNEYILKNNLGCH